VSAARERVLGALRGAARSSGLPRTPPPTAAPVAPLLAVADLLERFGRELQQLGGRLHRPGSDSAARDLVVALCRAGGTGPVLSWAPEALPLGGLWPALEAAGLELLESDLPHEAGSPASGDATVAGGRAARLVRLGEARTGLTGADAGLAETGSLLLAGGPGRSRLAWLLPERHVALLRPAALRFDLAELVAERPDLLDAGAGVALVAGPSRTADIELTLTRGVHGPRQLDVVVLP
jgi:L-lactate dehydrogenase complex protein LldG